MKSVVAARRLNKRVFGQLRRTGSDDADVTFSGRPFQRELRRRDKHGRRSLTTAYGELSATVMRLNVDDTSQGRIYSKQGPVQKNVGPLTWGGRPSLFSWEKTGDLFSHHRPCISCQFS